MENLFLLLLVVVLVAVGIFWLLRKGLRNVQPRQADVRDDVMELREQLKSWDNGLLVWPADEAVTLNASPAGKSSMEKDARVFAGVLSTDSQEPLVAFAGKNYIGPGVNAVMLALTDEREYVFRFTNNGIVLSSDEQALGTLRKDNSVYDSYNKPKLRIDRRSAKETRLLLSGSGGEQNSITLSTVQAPEQSEWLQIQATESIAAEKSVLLRAVVIHEALRSHLQLIL